MQGLPQAYQQLNPSGSSKLPALGSRALYLGAERTPSVRTHGSSTAAPPTHLPPPPVPSNLPAADIQVPFEPTSGGIPVARYRAKLEECARLHSDLEKTKDELQIAKQRIEGTQRDCGDVLSEASRLHDVVKVLTGELHTKQRRVQELELENKQLRQELLQVRTDMEILTASRAVLEKKKQELNAAGGSTVVAGSGAVVAAAAREDEFRRLFPHNKDCGVPTTFPLLNGSVGSTPGLSSVDGSSSITSAELGPGAEEPISFLQPPYIFHDCDEEEEETEVEEFEEDEEVEVEEELVVTPALQAIEDATVLTMADDCNAVPISTEDAIKALHAEEVRPEGEAAAQVQAEAEAESEVVPAAEAVPEEFAAPPPPAPEEENAEVDPDDAISSPPPRPGTQEPNAVAARIAQEAAEAVVGGNQTAEAPAADGEGANADGIPVAAEEGEPAEGEAAPLEATENVEAVNEEDNKEITTLNEGDHQCQFPEPEMVATETQEMVPVEEAVEVPPPEVKDYSAGLLSPRPMTYRRKKMIVVKKKVSKIVKKKQLPKSHRPRDVNNPVLIEYLTECFHHGCGPHVEALRSMYRGDGTMVMVKPPAQFDQMEVYEHLLYTPQPSLLGLWSASHIHSLSLRFEDNAAGVATVARMLPRLPLLRELEIFGVSASTSMQRLTEALAMASNIEVLSLPQLSVSDEGLVLLWNVLRQRQEVVAEQDEQRKQATSEGARRGSMTSSHSSGSKQLSSKGKHSSSSNKTPALDACSLSGGVRSGANTNGVEAAGGVCADHVHAKDNAEPPAPNKLLEIRTLDLSHCTVEDSMTIKSICCPGVEVMFLAGLDKAVTDTALHCVLKKCCPSLHTLDISGCVKVTTDAMKYFNRHEHLVVLRAENCPLIKKMELEHVQVLYSTLNYVNDLNMPALRRLPIPMQNVSLLRSFVAPQLEELTLHGMQIDHLTLQPSLMYTKEELTAFAEDKAEKQLHEEVRHDNRRNQRRFEAEEAQRKAAAEAAEAEAEAAAAAAALLPKGRAPKAPTPPVGASQSFNQEVEEDRVSSQQHSQSAEKSSSPDEDDFLLESTAPSSSLPPEEEDANKKAWLPNADRTTRNAILQRTAPPRLRLMSFIDCNFTDINELYEFIRQQDELQKLSLHHCSGVQDEHMKVLPRSLQELDLALTGSLSDDALRYIVTRAPELVRLNLKNAGIRITNDGMHSLYGLSWVQQLNLLGLQQDQVNGSTVSALAAALPRLTELYHEAAVVPIGGASAPGRRPFASGKNTSFLHVYRTDEESCWFKEVKASPLQLLRLRNSAALKLWMESTLPKLSTLWPVQKAHTMEVAADRAKPALLYTPTPPYTWMAQHPLCPGYTPLLIHPNGVAALRPLPGETGTPHSSAPRSDRDGPNGEEKDGEDPVESQSANGSVNEADGGKRKPLTPQQLAAARKKAALEASFSSSTDEEEEDHPALRVNQVSANVLTNPNEVSSGGNNNSGAGAGGGVAVGGEKSNSSAVVGGNSGRHGSREAGWTAVDQQAVEDAEIKPWGEEDALAEHQEMVRNIQQQEEQ